jgi:enoyl-CoA hydratase/carnithine racemase
MKIGKISIYLGKVFLYLKTKFRKPLIAAVDGYCLGGGLEIILMSDIIIAGQNAIFGLPETPLGIIPGGGGTQRIVREIGKSKSMQMLLTGDFYNVEQAYQSGLISEIVPFTEGE